MRDYTFERKKAATSTFSHPSLVSPHTPTLANPDRDFGLPTNNIVQAQTAESANQQAAQSTDEQSLLSPAIQQRFFGHDISRISFRPQTKLTVGEPGDKYEQEADWMANQVMRMFVADKLNAPTVQPVQNSLQRKCAACEEEEKVQTKPSIQTATDGGFEAGNNIESRLNSSKGGGSALPDEVRSFMEPRFGADFSGVQVHTGSEAVQMNRELNAQAFTHGSDVYFGAGKSAGNNELTAHELTHVVQQNSGIQAKSNTQAEILQRDCDPTLASCPPDQTTTATAIPDQTTTPATPDQTTTATATPDTDQKYTSSDQSYAAAATYHDEGGPYHPPEGTELKCGPDDDCSTLSLKINYLKHTIKRHQEWDIANPMPQYPGGRHAQEIAELENALSTCIDYTVKCRNQPQWVPAPESQKEEQQAPQQEKSTIEKALIALGLSVALVALVAAAILDPEPITKLTAAGLSYATAMALLAILGVGQGTSDHGSDTEA